MMRPLDRRSFLLTGAVALGVGAFASPAVAARTSGIRGTASPGRRADISAGIQPLTAVSKSPPGGYFSDPYPIPRGSADSMAPPAFSGSPKSIITCSGQFGAQSYASEPITIRLADSLAADASQHGATFQPGESAPNVWSENNNIVREGTGTWHMATTLKISNPSHPEMGSWTVIVHASPLGGAGGVIPTSWTADTLLIGSYDTPVAANYCGKYVEDSGQLYLTYSKRLTSPPNAANGIVAQPMVSATQVAGGGPTVLIEPEAPNDGLKSELFFGLTQPPNFRVTETGNVVRIDDIYVMTYSAGAFDLPTYKTGLAFSDSFLPAPGSTYKKILEVDTDGVWGTPGGTEVRYLLQAQESGWPNYVASQVLAPGVPSIRRVEDEWCLFFAGYEPDDAPLLGSGTFDGSHRRPFFMRLKVDIPSAATVSGTSGYGLASWITAQPA